jgi:hypothetical protein
MTDQGKSTHGQKVTDPATEKGQQAGQKVPPGTPVPGAPSHEGPGSAGTGGDPNKK